MRIILLHCCQPLNIVITLTGRDKVLNLLNVLTFHCLTYGSIQHAEQLEESLLSTFTTGTGYICLNNVQYSKFIYG